MKVFKKIQKKKLIFKYWKYQLNFKIQLTKNIFKYMLYVNLKLNLIK